MQAKEEYASQLYESLTSQETDELRLGITLEFLINESARELSEEYPKFRLKWVGLESYSEHKDVDFAVPFDFIAFWEQQAIGTLESCNSNGKYHVTQYKNKVTSIADVFIFGAVKSKESAAYYYKKCGRKFYSLDRQIEYTSLKSWLDTHVESEETTQVKSKIKEFLLEGFIERQISIFDQYQTRVSNKDNNDNGNVSIIPEQTHITPTSKRRTTVH